MYVWGLPGKGCGVKRTVGGVVVAAVVAVGALVVGAAPSGGDGPPVLVEEAPVYGSSVTVSDPGLVAVPSDDWGGGWTAERVRDLPAVPMPGIVDPGDGSEPDWSP
jgi:hypothetical protein